MSYVISLVMLARKSEVTNQIFPKRTNTNMKHHQFVLHACTLVIVIVLLVGCSSKVSKVEQISVLGMIPGVSTKTQVMEATAGKHIQGDAASFEIGGTVLRCFVEFLNDKLASILCGTGESSDPTARWTEKSNVEIHAVLVKGFTEKLGPPTSELSEKLRTTAGVEYVGNDVVWEDSMGNQLTLLRYTERVTSGMLHMQSADHIKKEASNASNTEKARKF